MDINNWQPLFTDDQVNSLIQTYKEDNFKFRHDISDGIISEICSFIVTDNSLTDRAKLFYLQRFEHMMIKSNIQVDEDAIDYKNSLPIK